MPELPDVEAQRRTFAAAATGRRVRSITAPAPDVLRNTTPQGLGRVLGGRRFGDPRRHGKWLIAPTDRCARLVVHFGMTGRIVVAEPGEALHQHDRVVLDLDGRQVRLRMMRKLGGVWRARSQDEVAAITGPLGPDAWGADEDLLRDRLGRRGAVKPALMDQPKVAGLGNLLADEVLWRARIHPRHPVADLRDKDWKELARTLLSVLDDAVDAGCVPAKSGWLTAVRDDPAARCPRCGALLERGVVGGRTTRWCPRCQEMRR